jgi:TRAP-type mannitol/chloroaromatic compound transport system permease small subunit
MMPDFLKTFVRRVDAFNYRVGRFAMYLIFAMLAVLLWSSLSKEFFTPTLWTLDIAKFLLVAYFLLGGAYSMQMGDHVRMDLVYGLWSTKGKAWADVLTSVFLIIYLVFLVYGGVNSSLYALQYGETSNSAWRPYMAPIKIIMVFGASLMLLQAISALIRDIATIRGEEI